MQKKEAMTIYMEMEQLVLKIITEEMQLECNERWLDDDGHVHTHPNEKLGKDCLVGWTGQDGDMEINGKTLYIFQKQKERMKM